MNVVGGDFADRRLSLDADTCEIGTEVARFEVEKDSQEWSMHYVAGTFNQFYI